MSFLISLVLICLTSLRLQQVSAQCWANVTCDGPTTAAFSGTWDSSIFAPATRSIAPKYVLSWPSLTQQDYGSPVTLSGNGSLLTYDFGIEVGGIISFSYTSSGTGQLGIAFSEAKSFIGEWSDSSNGAFTGRDGALYTTLPSSGSGDYIMPQKQLRGGFRYMTVFLETNSSASASLTNVAVELDFQPTWSNLQAYQGYFHSNDELLNRIWYAGAYTIQSNSVPVNTGRQVPFLSNGWANNATLGPGDTIIVDGAKRDRAVWPGDMGVAVPSAFVSIGDLTSVKNALQVMYNTQNNQTGAFAESGPPLSQQGSDTYHMWTMIGTYNYFLYTNDTAFLTQNWARYQHAMAFIYDKVDNSSLLNVTGIRDWARWQQGFHNTEANMILYHTLTTASQLATWLSNPSLSTLWSSQAQTLRNAINAATFDNSTGSYRDNDTATTLHPQDANSLSLLFSVPSNATTSTFFSKIRSIATALLANWTPIGPQTPELPYNISPFISSFELLGRLTQRDTTRALALLRTTWGWIINNGNSTQSTILEGYLINGSFSYRSNRGYDYDATYPSHSHGWSTGPTSGLTNYILGLDITQPLGSRWTLAPQLGDLTDVQGGFTTALGKFQAHWTKTGGAGGLNLTWSTPTGTAGVVTVPLVGSGKVGVQVNGENVTTEACGGSRSVSAFGEQTLSLSVEGGTGGVIVF